MLKHLLVSLATLIFLAPPAMLIATSNAGKGSQCSDICTRYKACFASDYDVRACTGRCEDLADLRADFGTRTDVCAECLDRNTCSVSFACETECAGIVP